mmetsp:Transcript_45654/g.145729  ORF Transcript_45654/g.145729 Transcript_45654/m.145729 type:complete len:252 (+) Transcript_45654:1643-2398(+)
MEADQVCLNVVDLQEEAMLPITHALGGELAAGVPSAEEVSPQEAVLAQGGAETAAAGEARRVLRRQEQQHLDEQAMGNAREGWRGPDRQGGRRGRRRHSRACIHALPREVRRDAGIAQGQRNAGRAVRGPQLLAQRPPCSGSISLGRFGRKRGRARGFLRGGLAGCLRTRSTPQQRGGRRDLLVGLLAVAALLALGCAAGSRWAQWQGDGLALLHRPQGSTPLRAARISQLRRAEFIERLLRPNAPANPHL